MEKEKYLFIELQVRDGERVHDHRVLHVTRCNNIDFAAEYYAAHFWGDSYREADAWFAWGGEIAIELTKVKELTKEKYEELYNLFYFY